MIIIWWIGKVVENLLSWSRIMKMPWRGLRRIISIFGNMETSLKAMLRSLELRWNLHDTCVKSRAHFIKDHMLGLCDKPAAWNSCNLPVIPVKLSTVKLLFQSRCNISGLMTKCLKFMENCKLYKNRVIGICKIRENFFLVHRLVTLLVHDYSFLIIHPKFIYIICLCFQKK